MLIISDSDMFRMLDEQGNRRVGWDVAREALERCGGGATYVLQIPNSYRHYGVKELQRMQTDGWNIHLVDSMEELIQFGRQFSRRTWG